MRAGLNENSFYLSHLDSDAVNVFNLQVREGADEQHILRSVHSIYNDIGVKDLTVEIELYD